MWKWIELISYLALVAVGYGLVMFGYYLDAFGVLLATIAMSCISINNKLDQ